MKTISALLSSIINLVGLIDTVINVTQQSTENVGHAIIDASDMIKSGVSTAKQSFDMENAKSLELLKEELAQSSSQSTKSTD